MPKMKTHKGTAKRFRVTGSGKLVRKQAGLAHFNAKKSGGRKRRLKGMISVAKPDTARMKALMGHQAPEGSNNDQS